MVGPANRPNLTLTDLERGFGWELMARHPNDVNADREHERGPTNDRDLDHVLSYFSHQVNHVAGQGRDRDVDQEPDGHMVGLEVNTDHRTDFEKDEQKKQVLDAGMTLRGHHIKKIGTRRPHGCAANCE